MIPQDEEEENDFDDCTNTLQCCESEIFGYVTEDDDDYEPLEAPSPN